MGIIVFLLLLEHLLLGIILVNKFDKKNLFSFSEKFASGIILGMTVGFLIILYASLIFNDLWYGIITCILLELFIILWHFKLITDFVKNYLQKIKFANSNRKNIFEIFIDFLFIFTLILIFLLVLLGVLFGEESQLRSINTTGFSDTLYHLGMIQKIANSHPFILEEHIFANINITYHFLVNFASATLLKLNLGILTAFHLPTMIMGISGIFLFFTIGKRAFRSSFLSFITLFLILIGSGLGFLWFFQDVQNINNTQPTYISALIETVKNPPHEYTHLDMRTGGKLKESKTPHNIVWIVPVISFLSHQRSSILGFSLFSFIFLFLWRYKNENSLWKIGLIAGFLPLIHIHTMIALLIAVFGWFIFSKNKKQWVLLTITTLIVSFVVIISLNGSAISLKEGNFFYLNFGWMTCEHAQNWFSCSEAEGTDKNAFIFWSKNFGIIFWTWILVLLIFTFKNIHPKINLAIKHDNFLKWIIAPSFFLFVIPNLISFQPWEFDNNKVLFYWWIMAVFITIGFANLIYQKIKSDKNKVFVLLLITIYLFLGTFAGIIDTQARILNFKKKHYLLWNQPNQKLATYVKNNSTTNSLFLTGKSPFNTISTISGRQLYMGNDIWLSSHGINIKERENIIKEILYKNNIELACNEKIDYILLDDDLLRSYPLTNIEFFKTLKIAYKDDLNNIFLIKIECTDIKTVKVERFIEKIKEEVKNKS